MSARDTAVRRALAAGLPLAALTADVAYGGRVTQWEKAHVPAPPEDGGAWRTITLLGDRPAATLLTCVAAGLALARHRSPAPALALAAGGVAVRAQLMRTVDRPRPPQERWREVPEGASYPSRHVTSLALALLALRRTLPAPARGRPAGVIVAGLVVLESCSRVRLGVHWPTDTIAGALLALLLDAVADLVATGPEAERETGR